MPWHIGRVAGTAAWVGHGLVIHVFFPCPQYNLHQPVTAIKSGVFPERTQLSVNRQRIASGNGLFPKLLIGKRVKLVVDIMMNRRQ